MGEKLGGQCETMTMMTVLQGTLQSSSPTKSTLSAQQPLPQRHKKFPTRLAMLSTNRGPVRALEVAKLISSSLNKTCQLDPAPTWLRCLLSPFIAIPFNESLATGCFPRKYGTDIPFFSVSQKQESVQPHPTSSHPSHPTPSVTYYIDKTGSSQGAPSFSPTPPHLTHISC